MEFYMCSFHIQKTTVISITQISSSQLIVHTPEPQQELNMILILVTNLLIYETLHVIELCRCCRPHCFHSSTGKPSLLFLIQSYKQLVEEFCCLPMPLCHDIPCISCVKRDSQQVENWLNSGEIIELRLTCPVNETSRNIHVTL